MITVGGSESESGQRSAAPPPVRGGPLLAAAGLAVGLTMGIVFAGGDTEPAVTTTTQIETVISPSASPTTTTTTIPVPVSRLATMAPGLIDTLVVMSVDPAGFDGITVWEPSGRNPVPANLPVGDLDVDSGHQWLAALTRPRYSDRGSLWVGNSAYMEPLAIDVLGMVWHRRLPGQIVWSEAREGTVELLRAELLPGRSAVPAVIGPIPEGSVPVWWTDIGVVIADPFARALHLVDDEGAIVRSLPVEQFIAGSDTVAAIVSTGGTSQLVTSDLVTRIEAPWDAACREGSFAGFEPDDELLALHCLREEDATFEVWNLGQGPPEQTASISVVNASDPGWTADSRLAYIAEAHPLRPSSDLIFVRPRTGEEMRISHQGWVLQMESLRS